MNRYIDLCFFLLTLVCVFDPTGTVLGIKYLMFDSLLVLFAIRIGLSGSTLRFNKKQVTIIFTLLLIGAFSAMIFLLRNGTIDQGWISYASSLLFLAVVPVIGDSVVSRTRAFMTVATLLSCLLVAIGVGLLFVPQLETMVALYGMESGNMAVVRRSYGPVTYLSLFYRTAPLLVFPLAYHTYRLVTRVGKSPIAEVVLATLSLLALMLSGTRANLLLAFVVPSLVLVFHSKKKLGVILLLIVIGSGLVVAALPVLASMFSAEDPSNRIKVGYFSDYMNVFQDPLTILLGQGFGASYFWTLNGSFTFQTELTYLEIFRYFGFFLGILFIGALLLPLLSANALKQAPHFRISFAAYLLICATNPFLFSSTGMLALSIVVANIRTQKATSRLVDGS